MDESRKVDAALCDKNPPVIHKLPSMWRLNRYFVIKDAGTKVENEDLMEKKIERKGANANAISGMFGGAVALPAPKDKADLTHVRAFSKALKALNAVNKRAGLVLHHANPVAMQLKRKDESKFKRFLAGLEVVRAAYMESLEHADRLSECKFGPGDVQEADKSTSAAEGYSQKMAEHTAALDLAIKENQGPLIQPATPVENPDAENPNEAEGEELKAEPSSQG